MKEYDIEIRHVDFPLHPDTPNEGMLLEDLFGGPSARPRIQASQQRLQALAKDEGLPMALRDRTYNSRLAQELGVWAEEQGRGAVYRDAAFRAYFVDGKNVASIPVLLDIASTAGLDRKAAETVITTRSHRAKVDAEWSESTRAGVTAVPTFEAGGRRVVGAQPFEVLEQLVVQAGAKRRANGK